MRLQNIMSNFHKVSVNNVTVYFSYETPIAFEAPGFSGIVRRENVWGPTTGKHLNYCDGGQKQGRLSGEEFTRKLASIGLGE